MMGRNSAITIHATTSRAIQTTSNTTAIPITMIQQFRDARDYEALECYTLKHLMGVK